MLDRSGGAEGGPTDCLFAPVPRGTRHRSFVPEGIRIGATWAQREGEGKGGAVVATVVRRD